MTRRKQDRAPTGKAIGYVRVSTKRQDLSPQAQAERLRHRAAERGLDIEIMEERRSGAHANTRPVLAGALAKLAAHQADALITTKLDRVARNLRDFLALDERARTGGWSLVVLDLDFDSSNPTGRLIRNVMAAIAEWEGQIIGERVANALAVKREREPDWRPGPATEIAASTEARIAALSADGYSRNAIAAMLNDEGVPTARGARWHASTIGKVLARQAASS